MSLANLLALTLAVAQSGAQTGSQLGGRNLTREWTYYANDNGIETAAGAVHVWHSADGDTDQHSYGAFRLDMPVRTVSYEIVFRIRFGQLGNVPARLELRAGGKQFFEVSTDSTAGHIRATLSGRVVYLAAADDVWRTIRLVGTRDSLAVEIFGKQIATQPVIGVPDLLLFGGIKGLTGHQSEAWLKLDNVAYRIPAAKNPEKPNFSAEIVSLIQLQDRSGARGWRWTARVKVTNAGEDPLDAFVLGMLKLYTEDYLEHQLTPVRWVPELARYTKFQPGDLIIKKGESAEIEFVTMATMLSASAKPTRASIQSKSGIMNLAIPPP